MINFFVDVFLHLDKHLGTIMNQYHTLAYLFLFLIIFCETGLVVTPFLPGDSLVFAAGALSATGIVKIEYALPIFYVAAVLGDTVNYQIGHFFREKVQQKQKIRFIKMEYIEKTDKFFAKHGGKTIIIARFVPIIRTFAPFVAGVGTMTYRRFLSFNIVGGLSWVTLFYFVGYFFGNLPFVAHNFSYVIIAIVLISLVPGIVVYLRERKAKKPDLNK